MNIDKLILNLENFKNNGVKEVMVGTDEEWNLIGELEMELNGEDEETLIIYPVNPEPNF